MLPSGRQLSKIADADDRADDVCATGRHRGCGHPHESLCCVSHVSPHCAAVCNVHVFSLFRGDYVFAHRASDSAWHAVCAHYRPRCMFFHLQFLSQVECLSDFWANRRQKRGTYLGGERKTIFRTLLSNTWPVFPHSASLKPCNDLYMKKDLFHSTAR